MLEHKEFQDLKPAVRPDARAQLQGMAQAALKAEAVTGDPSWDTFLSYIQRAIDVAEGQKRSLLGSLASVQMVEDAKIAQTRNMIFQLDERIRSLRWVITMPAEIKKVGSVAKEKLAQMEVVDEGESEDAA